MRRRTYLATLAATGVALAGCQGAPTADGGGNATEPTDGTGTPPTETRAPSGPAGQSVIGEDLPVPDSALQRGAPRDAIPAITDPVYDSDWSQVTARSQQYSASLPEGLALSDDDQVIGVERDGKARAYPLRVLNWHEVVNHEFGGPLLVTYCPL